MRCPEFVARVGRQCWMRRWCRYQLTKARFCFPSWCSNRRKQVRAGYWLLPGSETPHKPCLSWQILRQSLLRWQLNTESFRTFFRTFGFRLLVCLFLTRAHESFQPLKCCFGSVPPWVRVLLRIVWPAPDRAPDLPREDKLLIFHIVEIWNYINKFINQCVYML